MPSPSTVSAATLAWAVANTNKPGDETQLNLSSVSADAVGINTPAWNQVQQGLVDLNDLIAAANAYSTGVLTLTPGTIADDIVVINGVYYQFAASATSDGLADGTVTHPWQVKVGANNAGSLANLASAIGADGVAGTNYSTFQTAHPDVTVTSYDATHVYIRSNEYGEDGDAITTTVTSVSPADGLAWGGATLSGGAGNATTAQAAVDDWVDTLRYGPISRDDAALAEVTAAVPTLKTAIAALY